MNHNPPPTLPRCSSSASPRRHHPPRSPPPPRLRPSASAALPRCAPAPPPEIGTRGSISSLLLAAYAYDPPAQEPERQPHLPSPHHVRKDGLRRLLRVATSKRVAETNATEYPRAAYGLPAWKRFLGVLQKAYRGGKVKSKSPNKGPSLTNFNKASLTSDRLRLPQRRIAEDPGANVRLHQIGMLGGLESASSVETVIVSDPQNHAPLQTATTLWERRNFTRLYSLDFSHLKTLNLKKTLANPHYSDP